MRGLGSIPRHPQKPKARVAAALCQMWQVALVVMVAAIQSLTCGRVPQRSPTVRYWGPALRVLTDRSQVTFLSIVTSLTAS